MRKTTTYIIDIYNYLKTKKKDKNKENKKQKNRVCDEIMYHLKFRSHARPMSINTIYVLCITLSRPSTPTPKFNNNRKLTH